MERERIRLTMFGISNTVCVLTTCLVLIAGTTLGCGGETTSKVPRTDGPPAPTTVASVPVAKTATPRTNPHDPSHGDRLVAKMEGFVDKICDCQDMPCVKAEQKRAATFMMKASAELSERLPPTEQQRTKTQRATAKLAKCIAAVEAKAP